jgi:hypothetical protein
MNRCAARCADVTGTETANASKSISGVFLPFAIFVLFGRHFRKSENLQDRR